MLHTRGGGGGCSPNNGLYGRAVPERGTFLWLHVYEGVGILLVEVYERVGKSFILVYKEAKRELVKKTFWFCDFIIFLF